ncbi:MAG: hypothetical protein QXW43_04150, partial [Candidatus Methanomethyliaceae archaeon]
IAFPAMGAGVGGLSIEESAEAMLAAIQQHFLITATCLKIIFLVGLNDDAVNAFRNALRSIILK